MSNVMDVAETKMNYLGVGCIVPCIFCGEPAEITEMKYLNGHSYNTVKVCVNCKDAVMRVREQMGR